MNRLEELFKKIDDVPEEWFSQEKRKSNGSVEIVLKDCDKYEGMIDAWTKALKWTQGLDDALSVMLASVASTGQMGDQLWIKLVGPPGCGKTTLSEAITTNRQYIFPKDTFTGLTSGYATAEDGKNMSMVDQLNGKTLLINDGDTLLQASNLGEILSQLRAFYGGNIRAQYKNEMSYDFEGYRTTVILCGTSSLQKLDTSELGERFLDCIVMEGIDLDLEDQVVWSVAEKARRDLNLSTEDSRVDKQQSPEMIEAMARTGGYVGYLREKAGELARGVETPHWALYQCTRLGKFVAYMRARPSKTQDESSEREFGARLTSQMVRLMTFLAVVLNRTTIDSEVLRRTTKVALDTSRGKVLNICRYLLDAEEGRLTLRDLALLTGMEEGETKKLLKFLRAIGALKVSSKKVNGVRGRSSKPRWFLASRFKKLCEEVLNFAGAELDD